MATTPVYNLPYQGLTDPPNGPTLGEDLALAVEAVLQAQALVSAGILAALVPYSVGMNSVSGSNDSTISAVYVDVATPSSVAFVKAYSTTKIKVVLHIDFYATGSTATSAEFAIRINGVDSTIAPYHQSLPGLSVRLHTSGVIFISGLAAGPYTAQARWRRTAGTGLLARNISDDAISIEISEVR